MAFKTVKAPRYPRRLWTLVGFPGAGKSTFSMQMVPDLLVIDADHRVEQVVHLAGGNVLGLEDAADNVFADRIDAQLRRHMPEAQVGTIVVDSLTAIIAPLVQAAVLTNLDDLSKNRSAPFVRKASAMRLLQDAVTRWGTDVLWIYHLQHGRDQNAKKVVTTTIPQVELARLVRSINATLTMVQDGNRRGIRVDWCREGESGMTLWDDTGRWVGMPERLEEAMYPEGWRDRKRGSRFSGPDEAMAWAVAQGVFADEAEARAAYDKVKSDHKPASAAEMWTLWEQEVISRRMVTAVAGQDEEF